MDPAAIVRRIELAMINEAYRIAGDGVATPTEIDRAATFGLGCPVGPFGLAGRLGLRSVITGLRDLQRASPNDPERYRPAPSLWQMATV
jgi:3-hydroxyacyl-CoA dehydrogenase